MKKIITSGLFAVCLIALSQQEASAWVNSKFGIGLNWDVQSGGNSFLWGLWRNGQPPGPEAFGGGAARGFGAPQFGGPQFGPQPFAPQFQTSPPPTFVPSGNPTAFTPQFLDPSITNVNQGNPFQVTNFPRQVQPVQYYFYNGQWYMSR